MGKDDINFKIYGDAGPILQEFKKVEESIKEWSRLFAKEKLTPGSINPEQIQTELTKIEKACDASLKKVRAAFKKLPEDSKEAFKGIYDTAVNQLQKLPGMVQRHMEMRVSGKGGKDVLDWVRSQIEGYKQLTTASTPYLEILKREGMSLAVKAKELAKVEAILQKVIAAQAQITGRPTVMPTKALPPLIDKKTGLEIRPEVPGSPPTPFKETYTMGGKIPTKEVTASGGTGIIFPPTKDASAAFSPRGQSAEEEKKIADALEKQAIAEGKVTEATKGKTAATKESIIATKEEKTASTEVAATDEKSVESKKKKKKASQEVTQSLQEEKKAEITPPTDVKEEQKTQSTKRRTKATQDLTQALKEKKVLEDASKVFKTADIDKAIPTGKKTSTGVAASFTADAKAIEQFTLALKSLDASIKSIERVFDNFVKKMTDVQTKITAAYAKIMDVTKSQVKLKTGKTDTAQDWFKTSVLDYAEKDRALWAKLLAEKKKMDVEAAKSKRELTAKSQKQKLDDYEFRDITAKGLAVNKFGQLVSAADLKTQNAFKALPKTFSELGNRIKSIIYWQAQWYAMKPFSTAMVDLPAQAIQKMIQYNVQIDQARAEMLRWGATGGQVTEQNRANVEKIITTIRQQILTLPLAFEEASKSVQTFVAAGLPEDVVARLTPAILQLKTAFKEINFEQFGVAIVGMFNTFQKQGDDASTKITEIMNQLLKAQAVSILRPEQFPRIIQHLGAVAKIAGLTTEQMLALSVAVGDTGVAAGSAARYLANMMLRLQRPDTINILERMGLKGVDVRKGLGENLGLIMNFFDEVQKKAKSGDGQSMKYVALLERLFGIQAIKSAIPVIDQFSGKIKEIEQSLKNASKGKGGLATAAEIMAAPLGAQWTIFQNILNEVTKSVGLGEGTLKSFMNTLMDIGRGALLALNPKLAGAVFNVKSLGDAGTITHNIFFGLSKVFTILSNTLGPIITGLGKLVGALSNVNGLVETLALLFTAKLGLSVFGSLFGKLGLAVGMKYGGAIAEGVKKSLVTNGLLKQAAVAGSAEMATSLASGMAGWKVGSAMMSTPGVLPATTNLSNLTAKELALATQATALWGQTIPVVVNKTATLKTGLALLGEKFLHVGSVLLSFMGLTGPVGIAIGAISAFVIAASIAWSNYKSPVQEAEEATNEAKKTFDGMTEAALGLQNAILSIEEKELFDTLSQQIGKTVEETKELMKEFQGVEGMILSTDNEAKFKKFKAKKRAWEERSAQSTYDAEMPKPGEKKGGVDTNKYSTKEINARYNEVLAAISAQKKSVLEMWKTMYAAMQHYDDAYYSLGWISLDTYLNKKGARIKDEYQKEMRDLVEAQGRELEAFDKDKDNKEEMAQDTLNGMTNVGDKQAAIQRSFGARRLALLEKQKEDQFKLEQAWIVKTFDLDIEAYNKRLQIAQDYATLEANLLKLQQESVYNKQLWQLQETQKWTDWFYDKRETSATEYYASLVMLSNRQLNIELQNVKASQRIWGVENKPKEDDSRFAEYKQRVAEEERSSFLTLDQITTDGIAAVSVKYDQWQKTKYQNDVETNNKIEKAFQDFWSREADIVRKGIDDINYIYEKLGSGTAMQKVFADMERSLGTTAERMKSDLEAIGGELQSTFSGMLEEMMTKGFKNVDWKAMLQKLYSGLAKIVADSLTKDVFSSIYGALGQGGKPSELLAKLNIDPKTINELKTLNQKEVTAANTFAVRDLTIAIQQLTAQLNGSPIAEPGKLFSGESSSPFGKSGGFELSSEGKNDSDYFKSLVGASDNASQSLTSLNQNITQSTSCFGQLFSSITGFIKNITGFGGGGGFSLSGLSGGGIESMAGMADGGMGLGFTNFHKGGVVDGMYFHSGGLLKGNRLKNNERAIVAKAGERVLTEDQNQIFTRMAKGGSNGPTVVNHYHINAMDAASFSGYLKTNRKSVANAMSLATRSDNHPIRRS